jgi:hypothetical protein
MEQITIGPVAVAEPVIQLEEEMAVQAAAAAVQLVLHPEVQALTMAHPALMVVPDVGQMFPAAMLAQIRAAAAAAVHIIMVIITAVMAAQVL